MCHLVLFLPFLALPVFWIFPFTEALSIYLPVLGASLLLYFKVIKAMKMAPSLGKEAMLGKIATVVMDIIPEGKVTYSSEIWSASSEDGPIFTGAKVLIQGFSGMTLLVKQLPAKTANSKNGSDAQYAG